MSKNGLKIIKYKLFYLFEFYLGYNRTAQTNSANYITFNN